MNDQWQDDLRRRMELYEELAPDGLWESIEQLVPAKNKHWPWSKRIIPLIASAAAIALLFIVVFIANENQTPVNHAEESASIAEERPEVSKSTTPPTETLNSDPHLLFSNTRNVETTGVIADSEDISTEQEASAKQDITKEERMERVNDKEQAKNALDKTNDQLLVLSSRGRVQENSKWQTNLSLSNMPSSSARTYSGYGTFAVQETVEEQYDFRSQYTRQEVYTSVEHSQPVTFGLTLRYNLNEKWSVASGLTYSLLSSRLRSGSDNYYYDDQQTLHYIGVPLNVAYNFWQSNKFSSYVATGVLAEKNIAGRLSSNYYIDNRLESSTKESISSKQLQWSVNSAIGIEYRVTDFIGIYAEPGIAYYFKNSSELETFYKDNPFNFNLRIGLRFSITD